MENRIGKRMFESLILRYESEVAEAEATLMVYMETPLVSVNTHNTWKKWIRLLKNLRTLLTN